MRPSQLPSVPREILKPLRELSRKQSSIGLNEDQLSDRLDKLKELRILPEYQNLDAVEYDILPCQ